MLEVNSVAKSFGGVVAIAGSTFQVEKNKITALIGPNGAGKTTLFDIITGLIPLDRGTVVFEQEDISRLPTFARANRGMSRTFQQVRLFHYLTIADHIQMTLDHADMDAWRCLVRGRELIDRKWGQAIRDFGIERDLDTPVSDLSYGQQKLLDMFMALQRSHQLLLLDEPVAGVNQVVQDRIEHHLLSLKNKGETMLIIDHDMVFIRKLADHVIVLDAGAVLTEGPPDEVLSDKRVLEAYLGE